MGHRWISLALILLQLIKGCNSQGGCRNEETNLSARNDNQILNWPASTDASSWEDCVWTITAVRADSLVFVFTNASSFYTCVAVFEDDQSLLMCYTGILAFVSPRRSVTLQFRSDGRDRLQAFNLLYGQVTEAAARELYFVYKTENARIATDNFTYLTSPGYPANNSRTSSVFTWSLYASTDDSYIELVVNDSSLANISNCQTNYIAAYEGQITSGTILKKWCGSDRPTVTSKGSLMGLRYVTNGSDGQFVFRWGFRQIRRKGPSSTASTSTVSPPPTTCRGLPKGGTTLTAVNDSQALLWPNYTNSRWENCVWTIQAVDPDSFVFLYTNVSGYSNCFTIFQGVRALLMCYPGVLAIVSPSRSLSLQFRADGKGLKEGADLLYKQISETDTRDLYIEGSENVRIAIDDVSYLQSPDYPANASRKTSQLWTLYTFSDYHLVELVVVESHLEDVDNCSTNFMAAYNGLVPNNVLLQKWSGEDTPNVTSTSGVMSIRYVTNGTVGNAVFRWSFRQIPIPGRSTPRTSGEPLRASRASTPEMARDLTLQILLLACLAGILGP